MDLSMVPITWAQTAGSSSASLASLALRRWFVSLTLSSPEPVPSLFGLWAWLGGLMGLLVLAMVFQGPLRALGQVFDVAGHVRLLAAAVGRLRRSPLMVAVTVGLTVIAWTASQTATYNREQGREDLILLTRSRSLGELALEQGVLAALTPLRDLLGLGSNLAFLCGGAILVFRVCAERWANPVPYARDPRDENLGWANPVWVCASVYLVYRLSSLAALSGERDELRDLPWQGCLMIEPVLVPFLMAVCDGFLLAWILVELRKASLGETGESAFDPRPAIRLMPGAVLACVLAMPARYVAAAVWLAPARLPVSVSSTALGGYLRWQLNWGLADVQGAGLAAAGLLGAVAWTRGSLGAAFRGFRRLLAAEAGRLAVLLALAGTAAGIGSAVAYLVVLSLPAQTWVLSAADGYAHYATLPIGLLTLAALVELGERSLPLAVVAAENPPTPT